MQRGTTLRPAPELRLRLQKPQTKGKGKGLIVAGGLQLPRNVDGQKHYFVNTCLFDAPTELSSHGCCNIQQFRTFMENSEEPRLSSRYRCYAKAVIDYSISGVSNNVIYANRAHILTRVSPIVNNTVDCYGNVSNIFGKLRVRYDCVREVVTCEPCLTVRTTKKCVIPLLRTSIVSEHQYDNLERELYEYLTTKQVYCHQRNKSVAPREYTSGPYSLIDTQDAYNVPRIFALSQISDQLIIDLVDGDTDPIMTKQLIDDIEPLSGLDRTSIQSIIDLTDNDSTNYIMKGKPLDQSITTEGSNDNTEPITSSLAQIPTRLTIKGQQFVLCGVIKYNSSGIGHYTALCRKLNEDDWVEMNGSNKVKSGVQKSDETYLSIQIADRKVK